MHKDQFIDWASSESHLFFNRKDPDLVKMKLNFSLIPRLGSHIWISSSGSSGGFSIFALSKSAFLVSAESVNSHLEVSKKDIWLNVLPLHHVGGLSIFARAYVSYGKVIDRSGEKWSAKGFLSWAIESRATLTSLVPTQVHDLVMSGAKCPESIRAIIVGGASLSADLYSKGRELGYPLLPSYGMTECCSQIATASLQSLKISGPFELPPMIQLNHVLLKCQEDELLSIKSKSLFTTWARWSTSLGNWDVLWRSGNWFQSKDRVRLEKLNDKINKVFPIGRTGEQIKIAGEFIDLKLLNDKFGIFLRNQNIKTNFYIFAQSDARKGMEIAICFELDMLKSAHLIISDFNKTLIPLARIQSAYFIDILPRSDLHKIKTADLNFKLGLEVP